MKSGRSKRQKDCEVKHQERELPIAAETMTLNLAITSLTKVLPQLQSPAQTSYRPKDPGKSCSGRSCNVLKAERTRRQKVEESSSRKNFDPPPSPRLSIDYPPLSSALKIQVSFLYTIPGQFTWDSLFKHHSWNHHLPNAVQTRHFFHMKGMHFSVLLKLVCSTSHRKSHRVPTHPISSLY